MNFITEQGMFGILCAVLGIAGGIWLSRTLRSKYGIGLRKPDTKPSLALKQYAGAYEEAAYGRAEVAVEGDALRVKWGKYLFQLNHYHFDTFTAIPVEPKAEVLSFDRSTFEAQFRLGANGEIEGVKFLDQEFRRSKK